MQKIKNFKALFWKALVSLVFLGAFCFFLGKIFFSRPYHLLFPVQFSDSDIPYLPINIDNHSYLLKIDLGSNFQMVLEAKVLDQITKIPYGTDSWANAKGKTLTSPRYKLPLIEMGNLPFTNVFVRQLDPKGNCVFYRNPGFNPLSSPEIVGHIGKPLLDKVNLLFDFNHSLMLISNDLKKLREGGYDLKTFIKVPFKVGAKSVILETKTDLGPMRLVLDTGATCTMLRTSCLKGETCSKKIYGLPGLSSNIFMMGNHNFGPQNIAFFDISKAFDLIDGFLGMDFLKKHSVYIDFKDQMAYITP